LKPVGTAIRMGPVDGTERAAPAMILTGWPSSDGEFMVIEAQRNKQARGAGFSCRENFKDGSYLPVL